MIVVMIVVMMIAVLFCIAVIVVMMIDVRTCCGSMVVMCVLRLMVLFPFSRTCAKSATFQQFTA